MGKLSLNVTLALLCLVTLGGATEASPIIVSEIAQSTTAFRVVLTHGAHGDDHMHNEMFGAFWSIVIRADIDSTLDDELDVSIDLFHNSHPVPGMGPGPTFSFSFPHVDAGDEETGEHLYLPQSGGEGSSRFHGFSGLFFDLDELVTARLFVRTTDNLLFPDVIDGWRVVVDARHVSTTGIIIPEPASVWLFGLGFSSFLASARLMRRRSRMQLKETCSA